MINRSTIIAQFEQVAKEQNKKLASLSDDLILLESDLDSLCSAIIGIRLEDLLGFDPFRAAEDVDFPITVDDFIKFYENAIWWGDPEGAPDAQRNDRHPWRL
jgi:hypothetical protein